MRRASTTRLVARGRPPQQLRAAHEVWLAFLEHERAVGQVVEPGRVMALRARRGLEALAMELVVHRIRAAPLGVKRAPDLDEPVVVGAAAQRARTVARGERGRLVEEEQLREAAGLHQRRPVPAAELQLAGDPALDRESPPDAALGVVEAA